MAINPLLPRGIHRNSNLIRALVLALLLAPAGAWAQEEAEKPKQEAPAEAGGPQGDVGPIAVPKKKPEEQAPQQRQRQVQNPEGMADFSLRVDVPLVTLDVGVVTKDGMFIPDLKREHFRILEDGVPQPVVQFNQSEAPITAVLLVEFASTHYAFMYDALMASYSFAGTLRPEDWIAVVAYDMKSEILADFTQDKRQVYGALSKLRIPGFSETNLFDALYDTLDRLAGIEGRKYVILVSSGRDTFSKLNYDKIMDKVKETKDVTIYSIGTGQALLQWADGRGMLGPITRLDYLQAENQLNTFSRMTGGKAFFPRFEGQFRGIFEEIGHTIRNQYTLAYKPTNPVQDGSYRKLKVELIAPDGKELKITDQRGKNVKYKIIAREGYRAKHEVE